ncbi:GNAT family N-acetyltransferase [Kangiella taiwanensis]|uniref:N-acetyltransferase domain-containing protein n=1 Tax=Kangiella taiwanensis TaxID=1079179 RepID=A0ABP8HWL6_9GAMM|nr:GNAT family N-acetyltransferase [Kangiella taiwanensis]
MSQEIIIRSVSRKEKSTLGELMVEVYSNLPGFPSPDEQPDYYKMLKNIADLDQNPNTDVFVAVGSEQILGGVVYFSDMVQYGSGGTATQQKNASGFRLLAVSKDARGLGVGKALTNYCIAKAKKDGNKELIIHTTEAMKVAWSMYENFGFKRSVDLDFLQEGFPVYGFRLSL